MTITDIKEYTIYVCPPVGEDDIYPVYECEDETVYTQPGKCQACGAELQATLVSDNDFYLAIHELYA